MKVSLAIMLVGLVGLPAARASAQLVHGTIYGTVTDSSGAVLPGLDVDLQSNVTAPKRTTTGTRGEYTFTELDPGRYTLQVDADGFARFEAANVEVGVGTHTAIEATLAVAGPQVDVVVSGDVSMLDERSYGNANRFHQDALSRVPTARDPWVLMQLMPGVLVDRINVGGSESGQQSRFTARSDAGGFDTMWNIDGVTITDAAALGFSLTYYDFNAFEEVQFTTSSVDVRQQTGGLGVNMVTKRGTNQLHGMGRFLFAHDSLQGENIPADLKAIGFRGNRIERIAEFGADIGGSLVEDKLWIWGAAAKNDIRNTVITGFPDSTELTNFSGKVSWQVAPQNHFEVFLFRGEKVKIGRDAGVTRPPETTFDQGGPTNIYKFEDRHVFGPNLLVSGQFAYVDSSFFLTPQGGMDAQAYLSIADGGVWNGSFIDLSFDRPAYQTNVDGTAFFNTDEASHSLKFGFQYRRTPISSLTRWPGDQTYSIVNVEPLGLPPGLGIAELTRASDTNSVVRTMSAYVGDTTRPATGP